jgi:hypothetical protein
MRIQIKNIRRFTFIALLGLSGCAAHNPQTAKDALNAAAHNGANTNKIIFLEKGLPKDVEFDILGEVSANKLWYGGMEKVFKRMSIDARAMNADAIIYVNTWYAPTKMAFAAPHAHGTAVKIRNKDAVDLNKLEGEWH